MECEVPSARRLHAASVPQHTEATLGAAAFAAVDIVMLLFLLACFLSAGMAGLTSGALAMHVLGGSLGTIVVAAPTGFAVYAGFYSLLLVAVKKLAIGKFRPGRFPFRGRTYVRWLMWDRLVSFGNAYVWMPCLVNPVPSVYLTLWRAFGARLGAGCRIGTDTFLQGSLEGASIGAGCSVNGFVVSVTLMGGELLVADTVLEEHCQVGAGAVVEAGCRVRAGTRVEAGAVLPMGADVGGQGQVVVGSPAVVRRDPAALQAAPVGTHPAAGSCLLWDHLGVAAVLILVPLQVAAAVVTARVVLVALAPPDAGSAVGVAAAVGAACLAVVAAQLATLAVAVLAKWLLLGRLCDGQPVTPFLRMRKRTVDTMVCLAIKNTSDPFMQWLALWCLGARVHATATIAGVWPAWAFTSYDLLDVGASAFIGGGASAACSRMGAEGTELLCGISIGPKAYAGSNARLCSPVALAGGCIVAANSVVHRVEELLPGSVWRGNLACSAGRNPETAAQGRPIRQLLFKWAFGALPRGVMTMPIGCSLALMPRLGLGIWAVIVGVLIASMGLLAVMLLCGWLTKQPLPQKGRDVGVRFQTGSMRWCLWQLNVSMHALLYHVFGPAFRGSPLVLLVYRAWGMSIGRNVRVHNPCFFESQFVRIEDGATVAAEACVSPHSVELGGVETSLEPVALGFCTLLLHATVHGGSSLPAGVLLGSYAKPLPGQQMEQGREYDGVPCRPGAGAPARRQGQGGGSAVLRQLEAWCATQPEKLLTAWHARTAKAPACLSYAEVACVSGQLAWRLRNQWGLRIGDRLLLVFPPGPQFALAVLACFRAQVVAVPAYPPGPRSFRHDLRRLRQIAEHCDAQAVLTDEEYWAAFRKLRTIDAARSGLTACCQWGGTGLPPWHVVPPPSAGVFLPELETEGPPADALGFLQFSSGSTGEPKGVMIQHRHLDYQLAKNIGEYGVRISREDVSCSWLPQYHDLGLIFGVFMVVYAGATGHYMSPMAFLQDPGFYVEVIGKVRATISGMPNMGFQRMVDHLEASAATQANLSSLRSLLVGAEFTRPATMREFCNKFAFPSEKVNSGYGLAEHVLFVAGNGSVTDVQDGRVSVGCPGEGVQICIVDPGSKTAVTPGTEGEIWVQSPCVCAGYWAQAVKTRETFAAKRNDEASGGAWLRTGDIGRICSGQLFIMGRRKELIIFGGKNYFAEDVEASIADLPGLRKGRCVAFSIESEVGEELVVLSECRPAGWVSGHAGMHQELPTRVRDAVSKACSIAPTKVVIVAPGSVLKTSSGKLRRSDTRDAWAAGRVKVLVSRSWSAEVWCVSEEVGISSADAVAGAAEAARMVRLLPQSQQEMLVELARRLREDHSVLEGSATAETRMDDLALTSVEHVAFVAGLRAALPEQARPHLELAEVLETTTLGGVADLLLRLQLQGAGPAKLKLTTIDERPDVPPMAGHIIAHGQPAYLADCIVAGGGIVGLCFARDLATLGYTVAVLEASATIGGAWSNNNYAGLRLHQPGCTYRCLSLSPRWTKDHAAEELYRPTRDEVFEYIHELADHPNITVQLGHKYLEHTPGKDGVIAATVYKVADGHKFMVTSRFLCLSRGCAQTNSGAPVVPFSEALNPPEEQPTGFPLCVHSSVFSADLLARARAAPGRVVIIGSGKAALDLLGQFEASEVHLWAHRGHTVFLNRSTLSAAFEDDGRTERALCTKFEARAYDEPDFLKCRGPLTRRRQPMGGGVVSRDEVAHADNFRQMLLDDVCPHDAGGLLLAGRDPNTDAELPWTRLGAGDIVIFCTGQQNREWTLPRYEARVATVSPMTLLSSPLNALLPLCLALDQLEGDGKIAGRMQMETEAWTTTVLQDKFDARDLEQMCTKFLSGGSQALVMTAVKHDLGLLSIWKRGWHGQDLDVRSALRSLGFCSPMTARGLQEVSLNVVALETANWMSI